MERAQQVAGREGFFSALVLAVKAGIHARHHLDPLPLSTAEIAARIEDAEAIELLRMLDRTRFAREAPDPDPLLERVRAYLGL